MPKRTNALQKAIKLIENHKGDFLKLRESAMLYDRYADTYREVDILLEGELNSHSIKVAIEVTDQDRPVDTQWVEQIISKHDSLPTDKLILVSSSGFAKTAEKKAKALGAIPIDTSGGDQELKELLEKAAYIRGVRIQVLVFVDDTPVSINAKLQIGDSIATVKDQIQVLLKNERFKEIILNSGNNNEPGIIVEFRSSFSINGKDSCDGQILKFVIFTGSIPDVPVKLSTLRYQGIDYVYGEVGDNANYFVMDMNGELIGSEETPNPALS